MTAHAVSARRTRVLQLLLLLAHSPRGAARRRGGRGARQERLDRLQPAGHAVPGGLRGPRATAPTTCLRGLRDRRRRPTASACPPAWTASSTSSSRARTSAPTSRSSRGGTLVIPLVRGRQGMPRIPGLGLRDGRERARARAGQDRARRCSAPPAATATSTADCAGSPRARSPTPTRCAPSSRDVRAGAIAADCEEFAEDFCCLAMPGARPRGTRRGGARDLDVGARLRVEREELERVLRTSPSTLPRCQHGRLPAISEEAGVLEDPAPAIPTIGPRAACRSRHRGEGAPA